MSEDTLRSTKRLLEPMERISEILFGLIMVLTFTCSFSVAGAGRRDVYKMLLAALGCNLAWGIIDAIFYLMSCLSEQGRGILALRELRKTADPEKALLRQIQQLRTAEQQEYASSHGSVACVA